MNWRPQMMVRWASGFSAVALCAATGMALVSADVPAFLDGVDATGNPSAANGGDGAGKSFKDTEFGIVVQISAALVRNEFGRPRVFSDRGVPVVDPETNDTLTATTDLEVVSRPFFRQGALAVQLGVYDPEPVEPSED
jgi:hypothetical protein